MSGKIVAGIDEAGLGPRLGPLVITQTSFEIPKSPALSMKTLLADAVSRDAGLEDERLRVDDSKLVYRGALGLSYLERTVLGFHVAIHGDCPKTLRAWLDKMAYPAPPDLEECPWLGSSPLDLPLPRKISPQEIRISGERLRARLAAKGVTPFPVRQEIITAPSLNQKLRKFNNKSAVLSASVGSLIREVAERDEESPVEIDVDKLGGRIYYAGVLRGIFPLRKISVKREKPRLSEYSVNLGKRSMMIRFLRKGDSICLQIALASMFSKYTRELFMLLFNRFWCSRRPGLKPTAGYPVDAGRFLREVESEALSAGIDPSVFTRLR